MALLPILHEGYSIADTLRTVENLDVDTIVCIAQEGNVDAILAEEDLELRNTLDRLGIRYITADVQTASEKILDDVIATTSAKKGIGNVPLISIDSSPAQISSLLNVIQSTIKFHGNPLFPLLTGPYAHENKVKLIVDHHGNKIAFDRSCSLDFAVVEFQIAMGIPLYMIPQVCGYLGRDTNGIDHINVLESCHHHIYVLTAEVPPEELNNQCISLSACVFNYSAKRHLVVTGESRAVAIKNTQKAVGLMNDNLGQVKVWLHPGQDLQFKPTTTF
jgi:hypothetical protein